jgi:hypothetical protein
MPKCSDLLARLSEFLADIAEEPSSSRYTVDKATTLQEEIDLWLEAHEEDCGED